MISARRAAGVPEGSDDSSCGCGCPAGASSGWRHLSSAGENRPLFCHERNECTTWSEMISGAFAGWDHNGKASDSLFQEHGQPEAGTRPAGAVCCQVAGVARSGRAFDLSAEHVRSNFWSSFCFFKVCARRGFLQEFHTHSQY